MIAKIIDLAAERQKHSRAHNPVTGTGTFPADEAIKIVAVANVLALLGLLWTWGFGQ